MTIHIIPEWHDNAIRVPEFDDSLHQTQLFLSQGQDVILTIIDFLPNLNQVMLKIT